MNPVIGDKALELAGCSSPGGRDDSENKEEMVEEVDRIRCHLYYALRELQAASDSSSNNTVLPSSRHRYRAKMLRTLEQYISAGQFPSGHEDWKSPTERKPCFVDRRGTPCAVAHLMRESELVFAPDCDCNCDGKKIVMSVAEAHNHDTIADMLKDDELASVIASWSEKAGLLPSELALIQPTYEFEAARARRMFESIMGKIRSSAQHQSESPSLEKVQMIDREIAAFGVQLRSGFGYPLADIPMYIKALDEFDQEFPIVDDGPVIIRDLVAALRKEVNGSRRGG